MSNLQMIVQEKIQYNFSISKERFSLETKCIDDNRIYIIFNDVIDIFLNYTNQEKVPSNAETLIYRMAKDYYFFNDFNKVDSNLSMDKETTEEVVGNVKSIQRGNEKIEFSEVGNSKNINGTSYATGTINPDEDIIFKKYSSQLNKFRRFRW